MSVLDLPAPSSWVRRELGPGARFHVCHLQAVFSAEVGAAAGLLSLKGSTATGTVDTGAPGAPPGTHRDGLGFLPVGEQVGGAALHGPIFLDDLHLQVCHLLLDGGVLPPHDVVEGAPLALDVVNIKPGGRELEPLLFQQALAVAVEL